MKKVPENAKRDNVKIIMKTRMSLMTYKIVEIKWPKFLKILKKYRNLSQMKKEATAFKYLIR